MGQGGLGWLPPHTPIFKTLQILGWVGFLNFFFYKKGENYKGNIGNLTLQILPTPINDIVTSKQWGVCYHPFFFKLPMNEVGCHLTHPAFFKSPNQALKLNSIIGYRQPKKQSIKINEKHDIHTFRYYSQFTSYLALQYWKND